MLGLAEDLLKDLRRGRRGVTLNVIADFAEKTLGVDVSESCWKAQQLTSRALEAGLLETSTEDLRGVEEADIQANPSYDFGPALLSLRRALGPWYDTQSG